ncbi:MAG: ABC transporter ATP-binding protein/permease [Oscillospiraceae bacterium]|nr:ABC transporter ATP-binding protein/permease [Oscillospiraceae bacterium]
MKKLLVYLKAYKKETLLGPLFKLLEAGFELLVPLMMAAVIDRGIAKADSAYILRMCLALAGLGIVGLVCSVTAQYFAAKASAGFVKKLKHALFAHIQRLSFAQMDRLGTSTLVTRMTSDMNQLQVGANLTLRLLLRSPFVVFGAILMAFTVDAEAALVFAAAVPVLLTVVFAIMLLCVPLYKKVQARLDQVLGLTRESLSGARVIRAFRKETEQAAVFEGRNNELTRMQKRVGRISALLNPVTYVIVNLAVVFLVQIGAVRVWTGALTQGAVVALYGYMSQILTELIKLADYTITLTKSVACGNRIQAVFEISPDLGTAGFAPPPENAGLAVVFRHASLRYENAGENALTDIDFSVRCGETIGIIGGTGSGKSSLVSLIPRFYDASEGEVRVCGVNVKDYPVGALRAKIGFVPQKAALFKGTIRENLRWGKPDATDAEIWAALTAAQAKDVAESRGGLGFSIEQDGRNLSGGQIQRLTVARALVRVPEILILDDSASALDFATDAALRKAIRGMAGSPTVFIVSQRVSALRHADRIIVLDDGRLAGVGTAQALLERCEVYREICQSQLGKEDPPDDAGK